MENEQNQESFQPLEGTTPATSDGYNDSGWSWGGAMFNLNFAIATRHYWYLLLIILMIVPFVNFVVFIGLFIFFGIKGRDLAKSSRTFANDSERLGFMKGIDHAGKVIFFVGITMALVGIIASITLASFASQRMKASGVLEMQQKAVGAEEQLSEEEMMEMQEEMMKFFQE